MGVENNECVAALTWKAAAMQELKEWVNTLSDEEQSLFAFVPALTNGKETAFLAPDGSKKGWGTSKQGEALRDKFIAKLEQMNNADDPGYFEWVEVGWGEYGQKLLRGNNSNLYSDDEYAA